MIFLLTCLYINCSLKLHITQIYKILEKDINISFKYDKAIFMENCVIAVYDENFIFYYFSKNNYLLFSRAQNKETDEQLINDLAKVAVLSFKIED